MKTILMFSFACFILLSLPFYGHDRWEQFNPEPLTILSPAEISLSNPPFFHWQHLEEARQYVISLRGIDIDKQWETGWNFYTPGEFLDEGFYSFTVTAYDRRGNVMETSSHKEFRITSSSAGFVADWNKIQFPRGTRYFVSDEQIQEIRNAVDIRREYRQRILELADNASLESILQLTEPEEYQDGIWNHARWTDINNTSYKVDTFMQQQTLAYLLTGDEQFAEKAIQAMNHAARWDPLGSTSVWSSDHSAQSLLHALSIGYSTFRNMMEDEVKEAVRKSIRERSADMYRFLNPFLGKITAAGMMNDPDNNHPWFCTVALANGAMALMGEEEKAPEWLTFAAQLFHGQFLPRGDSTGGWHEGIDYWSYMLYFVMQMAHSLNTVEGVNLFHHPWLQNTAHFKIAAHPPVGAHVPFGNSHHRKPNHYDQLIMMKLASVYREPLMWKYVDAIDDRMHDSRLFFALLWYERDEMEAGEIEVPQFFHFEDMGWVIAVSDIFNEEEQRQFAFKSGPFFGRRFNHSHGDQNHFVITAGGERLIWDAGYYDGYLFDHHRHFTVQSIAHNVLLFDGEGQVVFTPGADGKITRFEPGESSLVVQGDAGKPVIYGGRAVKFIRTVTMEDFKTFVIEDDIQADHLRQISWLLQSVYPIQYDPETREIRIMGDKYQVAGIFKTDVPLEAVLRDTFPVQPVRTSHRPYPEQYQLELRTTEKIEFWQPRLVLEILPAGENK